MRRAELEAAQEWAEIGRGILEDGAAGERAARRFLHETHEREELSPRVVEVVVLFAKMMAEAPNPGAAYRRTLSTIKRAVARRDHA